MEATMEAEAMDVLESDYDNNMQRIQSILSDSELSTLSDEIAKKINDYINVNFVEKTNHPNDHKDEGGGNTNENEEPPANLEHDLNTMKDTLTKIKNLELEIKNLNKSIVDLENNNSSLKSLYDMCNDEKNNLSDTLKRRDSELEELKNSLTDISSQLHLTILAKSQSLVYNNELQIKEKLLQQQEKKIEDERTLLNSQISCLTDEVNRLTSELQNVQFNNNNNLIKLETKLRKTSEELDLANKSIVQLQDLKLNFNNQIETLTQKLFEQREMEFKMKDNYLKEINSKSKLADMYKMMNEDVESKTLELTEGVAKLQNLLYIATEKYGELETKYKQNEIDNEELLKSKEEIITSLKAQLEHGNELLRVANAQNLSKDICDNMSPSAAIAGKILKSDMSLSHIYYEYEKISTELVQEREDNRRLNEELHAVVEELQNRAPMLHKEKADYEEALDYNIMLTEQIHSLKNENKQLGKDKFESSKLANYFSCENNRLKKDIEDLQTQICFLLKEIENTRGVTLPNGDYDPSHANSNNSNDLENYSNDNSSKSMITFSDIQELQSTNLKLLRKIRDMTEEQDKEKNVKTDCCQSNDLLESKIAELTAENERQNNIINDMIKQRDMYKKLYHQNINTKDGTNADSEIQAADTLMEKSNKNILELNILEKKFNKNEQILEDLKQEYKLYKEDKIRTEKEMYEIIANMRQEISDLKGVEDKYSSASEHKNEQLKILDTNLTACKIEISSLEEKESIYSTTISKQEVLIQHLREDIAKLKEINISTENKIQKYALECEQLKTKEYQFKKENELLKQERENSITVINHLEFIKLKLEKNYSNNQEKIEKMLDDSMSECAAMRRRLEEEQNRFKELTLHYETQLEKTSQDIRNHKIIADEAKNQIVKLQENLENQNKYNEELSKKLEIALGTNTCDYSLDFIIKNKYLENKLNEKDNEIRTIQEQLKLCKEHIKQYCNISDCTEGDINSLKDEYIKHKEDTEEKIKKYIQEIQNLRDHCLIIEKQLSMQVIGESSTEPSMINDNDNIKEHLKDALESLEHCQIERNRVSSQLKDTLNSLQVAERKYEREMVLHSLDIQTLTKVKEDIAVLRKQNSELIAINSNYEKDKNMDKEYCKQLDSLKTENRLLSVEIERLNKYNLTINDQIQALSSQLSVTLSAQPLPETYNEIASDAKCNVSVNDGDGMSSDQLIRIIKCLRNEKDAVISKCDLLQTDALNLKSQLDMTEKHLEDTKVALNEQRDKSETTILALAKHSDILRKLETLDALTDSNRILRTERDTLLSSVDNLNNVVLNLEGNVSSLQEKISELSEKCRVFECENTLLKTDCARWKDRANSLVENANKVSPDDWKLLQNDRDNLSKCLQIEKENVNKFTDELNLVLNEKNQLSQKYELLLRKHKSLDNDHKHLIEELSKVKKDIVHTSEETLKLKTELKSTKEINEKLKLEISLKETELTDIRNKEMQIRKIAKKYKVQYEELVQSVENEKNSNAKNAAESEIAELKGCLDAERINIEKLKSDLESSVEKEEKAKQLLKVAKSRIVQLSETKNKLANELNETKIKLENIEQNNRDEQDVRLALIKSQYEGKLSRLEKEREETTDKSKDVEILMQKVNQLQRQLASHTSSSKPTSLEKTASDPPTANIKPMAACAVASVGASGAGAGRRAGEPPLASIRPVAQVGPTAPHDAHSTEYMPASSSRPRAEDTDAAPEPGPPPQQVALVLPRVEPPGVGPPGTPAPPADVSTSRPPDRPPKRPRAEPRGPLGKRLRAEPDDYQLPTSSQRDRDDDAPQAPTAAEPERPVAEAISSGTEPVGALSPGADDGDDGIVPSTPTLYVPRRGDGFGEAAVSPAPAPVTAGGARFTFAEAGAASHHDTHADLALPTGEWRDEGAVSSQGSAPASPRHVEEGREAEASATPPDQRRRARWPPLR